MRRTFLLSLLLAISSALTPVAIGQENTGGKEGTTAEQNGPGDWFKGVEFFEGYFTFAWNHETGQLWLAIDKLQTDFLYVHYLSHGLGSNDIGLDRGQIGATRVVRFERIGPKVLLVQPNLDYRALSDNPDEVAAVEQGFAKSVLWGFKVEEENDEAVWVDATDFLLRDAHDVIGALKRSEQGGFKLDESRSALNFGRTRNFPLNTEIDVILTFAGDEPGRFVRQVAPDPKAVTVHQHHSFIQLPDDGYTPRLFDPRAGVFPLVFYDYASPIDRPLETKWIRRHRLAKKDPAAAVSEPLEPIIYYLDRGTPEPVRSALLDGAGWWSHAFEAAGYRDAFRVEMLPEGADPLDVRYNVIQWVHRATRGWSYGSSVTDPRTGEIIKGHVTLGSLRVRQDVLIAQGLLAPFKDGNEDTSALREMALARLRQLSAHEVGHTLGFAHNFAASVNDRASVMDYPHPFVTLDENGDIDLSNAYGTGIGAWDKVTVAYAYQDFPEGTNEESALRTIVEEAIDSGLRFISDQDARPPGGAHPAAHLWDNGADPAEELLRVLDVRAVALNNFSEANIRTGDPMSSLEEVLVPLFLFHRYQAEAAVKLLGGLHYSYAVRGDGQLTTDFVDPDRQGRALDALLLSIHPDALTLSEHILLLIPPRAFGSRRHRETFDLRTGPALDPLAMAEMAADLVVSLMLHPARAARLVEHHARDEALPGLDGVIDGLVEATWKTDAFAGLHGEVQRTVNDVVLHHLMRLAADEGAGPLVRAITDRRLEELAVYAASELRRATGHTAAQLNDAVNRIRRFRDNPADFSFPEPPEAPPGSPIGAWDDFCSVG